MEWSRWQTRLKYYRWSPKMDLTVTNWKIHRDDQLQCESNFFFFSKHYFDTLERSQDDNITPSSSNTVEKKTLFIANECLSNQNLHIPGAARALNTIVMMNKSSAITMANIRPMLCFAIVVIYENNWNKQKHKLYRFKKRKKNTRTYFFSRFVLSLLKSVCTDIIYIDLPCIWRYCMKVSQRLLRRGFYWGLLV